MSLQYCYTFHSNLYDPKYLKTRFFVNDRMIELPRLGSDEKMYSRFS